MTGETEKQNEGDMQQSSLVGNNIWKCDHIVVVFF